MKDQRKKIPYLVRYLMLCCCCAILFSGCWDRRDVTHLGVVGGVAIDREDNGLIRVTVSLLNGSPGNTGNVRASGDFHLTACGETVYQAVSNLEFINNRMLSWQHNSIIIIGEKALDQSIFDYVDMFLRKDLRPKALLVVTPGRAFDLINTPIGDDWVNALGIARLLYVNSKIHRGAGYGVSINDFITAAATPNASPYLPILTLQEKEPDKKESAASESATSQGQLTEEVALIGFMVFRDGIPVGSLGDIASKGLLWYSGRAENSTLSITDEKGGIFNLEIVKLSMKPKFQVKDGTPFVTVRVDVDSAIVEMVGAEAPKSREDFQKLEENQSQVMTEILKTTLHKSQELQADYLQIGQLARSTNYKWWKKHQDQWRDIFPQVQMEVTVNSHIAFAGNLRDDVAE
ncbi:MAG: Ger(x)C family spore germination protein [Peptococcaceae bacterium]|jgi:spore germination protein KC|nr:Ger(x)C family spore germination protein [Peptococcaceae bacterium]